MENQTENTFEDSGLSRLTKETKWQDERYRKSVMASLVKGVYVLKDDHRRHRQGSEALAPPWWESFGFKLVSNIMDDGDCSVIGAVYEYDPKSNNNYDRLIGFFSWHMFTCITQCLLGVTAFTCVIGTLASILNLLLKKRKGFFSSKERCLIGAPKYVIAFRGTSTRKDTFIGDMSCNANLFINKLHRRSRFRNAIQAVENMVSEKGADNIWLAGHSLGASVAMLAGKTMAKEGNFLESYLYNPPFIAAPIEFIPSEIVRNGILVSCSLITLSLAAALQDDKERQQSEDLFTTLSPWVPNLFLHPADTICSGYIAYFEQREMLESWGLENVGRLATRHSWQGLFMNAIGVEDWSEELHLIPSACVTTSCNPESHKLRQWFTDDSVSDPKLYRY
ncbi:hypothetical protein MKX03_033416 [Papaver bracteatum]|nr:hypothetical protein MKX03_033416 [Papaver bracteatum]